MRSKHMIDTRAAAAMALMYAASAYDGIPLPREIGPEDLYPRRHRQPHGRRNPIAWAAMRAALAARAPKGEAA